MKFNTQLSQIKVGMKLRTWNDTIVTIMQIDANPENKPLIVEDENGSKEYYHLYQVTPRVKTKEDVKFALVMAGFPLPVIYKHFEPILDDLLNTQNRESFVRSYIDSRFQMTYNQACKFAYDFNKHFKEGLKKEQSEVVQKLKSL